MLEVLLSHLAPRLHQRKKRNENAEKQDRENQNLKGAPSTYLAQSSRQAFSVDQALDDILDNFKAPCQQSKYCGLEHRYAEQRVALPSLAQFEGLSDHDYLGQHRRLYQRGAVDGQRLLELVQQQHFVGGKGKEKDPQIAENDQRFPHFMLHLRLDPRGFR